MGGRYAIGPMDPMADTFETQVLTHDEGRWAMWRALIAKKPDIRLGGPTWSWIEFALETQARLETSATLASLSMPLVIVAAEEERLVDNAASRAVAARAPQARYVEVEGAFHEILMETDPRRARFFAEFDVLAEEVSA
jgi:lysophospholipase